VSLLEENNNALIEKGAVRPVNRMAITSLLNPIEEEEDSLQVFTDTEIVIEVKGREAEEEGEEEDEEDELEEEEGEEYTMAGALAAVNYLVGFCKKQALPEFRDHSRYMITVVRSVHKVGATKQARVTDFFKPLPDEVVEEQEQDFTVL
jgi:hypothetical protein